MKRILIIEDDEAIAQLEKDYLEMASLSVDIESNGKAGLDKALSADYDLIIVDLMLPDRDGFSICKAVRQAKDTPIVIISARTADIDKIRGFGAGADDYMIKPFSPAELAARVQAHLNRYERLTGNDGKNVVTIDDVNIDLDYRSVKRAGRDIVMTASEWCILEFLVKDRGRIRSKEEIFERLHGDDIYGDLNAVAVHVRRLREKLERDPADPKIIETVWGMGYRLGGR
jgi:DNA-binding response OmpR family regulator